MEHHVNYNQDYNKDYNKIVTVGLVPGMTVFKTGHVE